MSDLYNLFKNINGSWKKIPAYKAGIINENGRMLKSNLTETEKTYFSRVDQCIIKLKYLIEHKEFNLNTFHYYAPYLYIIAENTKQKPNEVERIFLTALGKQYISVCLEHKKAPETVSAGTYLYNNKTIKIYEDITSRAYILNEQIYKYSGKVFTKKHLTAIDEKLEMKKFDEFLNENKKLLEDTTTSNVDIVDNRLTGNVVKRSKFANADVFEVPHDIYQKCMHGKEKNKWYRTFVGASKLGKAIHEFATSNPRKPIILKNSATGSMVYLRK